MRSSQPRLYPLRQAKGEHEVDILVEYGGGRVVGIELKATSAPRSDDAHHLNLLRDELETGSSAASYVGCAVMGYTYVRVTEQRLSQALADWEGTVNFYFELDATTEESVVGIAGKTLRLLEFLLENAGTPVRLSTGDESYPEICPPSDVAGWMLAEYQDSIAYFYPADVRRVARVLAAPFAELVAKVDLDAMAAAGLRLTPDLGRRVNYDKSLYDALATLFRETAAANDGLLVFV